jgi:hypothetical protein
MDDAMGHVLRRVVAVSAAGDLVVGGKLCVEVNGKPHSSQQKA